MSKAFMVMGAVSILSLGGLAQAASPDLKPEQYVAARQASLDMSTFVKGSMQSAMKSGLEAKTQGYAAQSIARWGHVLPTLFPAGTGEGQTSAMSQAKPTIWSDRPGFEKAAANYADAADLLLAKSKANDTEGFKAQLEVLSHACDACHAVYKDGPQSAPSK